jgi:integrase
MVKNRNHPLPNSIIRVEPFRESQDLERIRVLLKDRPRDLCILNLGVNTNLRAIDLVNLTVNQVRYLKPGELLELRESKTKKRRSVTINQTCYRSIQALLNSESMNGVDDATFLFQSRKGRGKLRANTLNTMVKKWAREINLKGNYGSHTLRKTFGYIHRTKLGTDIPTLMRMFNHSTQRQTLEYLCIQPQEIRDAYMKEI